MQREFRPDIQGLRAIAVLAVLLDHASVPFFGGGYTGVDVFFVISGFLITSHLVERLATTGRVGFADFYARRARRILPAALVVIVLSVIGALIWMPPLLLPEALRDAVTAALYLPNYAQAAQGTNYLTVVVPSLFQHYWSLGVEEQFYLVWPALLAGVWAVARGGSRRHVLPAVLGAIVLISLVLCVLETARDQPWAFFPLWTRAWELGAGGLAAVLLGRRESPIPARVGAIASWGGLAAIAAAVVGYSDGTKFPGVAAVLPVAGAVLVIVGGAAEPRRGAALVLNRRPMQFVGRISYSLYLVHWPILILGDAAAGAYADLAWWQIVGLALLALPVAWLLNRFVEDPARRAAFLALARPRVTGMAVAGATAVVAAIAAIALAVTSAQPLDSGRAVRVSALTEPPAATGFVPSNLKPSLLASEDDNAELYNEGCQVGYTPSIPHPCFFGAGTKRIVLFGDSHAAAWFPAVEGVAENSGFRLETQTKSACPSVDVAIERSGKPYDRCDKWRANVIAELRADPPQLVVLANYPEAEFADHTDQAAQWERGLASTIQQLSNFTKVAVIADTPDMRHTPAVCLSQNLKSADECAQPAAYALDPEIQGAERHATATTDATLVDLTDYFCTTECPAIIGSTLVYRDSHHLTATFSAELAAPLGARLAPLLRP